jgi:uncharacterized protein (TIGR02145 family)
MAENLKVTHYRNGEDILYAPSDSAWAFHSYDSLGTYCAYNDDIDCADTCGYLYNWYATIDPNGLAPEGWHVPTDDDWKQLELFIGMEPTQADTILSRGTNEGKKLKASYGWYTLIDGIYWKGNGSDDFGFSAFPCGVRYVLFTINHLSSVYVGLHNVTGFWTSTSRDNYYRYAWRRSFDKSSDLICRDYIEEYQGCSIRCIKDSE